MPQMFPTLWLLLFIMISLSFMVMTSLVFFSLKSKSMNLTKINSLSHKKNWKW